MLFPGSSAAYYYPKGGTIKGSINLPAQSLYYSLPTVLNLCQSAGIELVIWYCGEFLNVNGFALQTTDNGIAPGSSRGRGTRAAGWFDDLIKEQNVPTIRSAVLEGGIAGWAKAGEEYNALMDEYSAEFWYS